MSTILVLLASPSVRSRTATLARVVADDLGRDGHDVRFLDLKDLPAESLLRADTSAPAVTAAVQQVLVADALVVATPIYKASYSGLLKTFLDLLPQHALLGKVVLPLATGGTIAHVLAIDYSLRPVLAALGAAHVTAGRFVIDRHIDTSADVVTDEATRECLVRTAHSFRLALRDGVLDPAGVPAASA